jgi:hypothetical protein
MKKEPATKQPRPKETADGTTAIEKVPQPHGGALNRGGTPGNKGGRPPDEFKAIMRELASSAERMEHARKILDNPDHPHFLNAWKFVTEQGYGKAKETVEHSGTIHHGVVVLPALESD